MSTDLQIWLAVGSQHLYGPETLEQVAANARQVADGLTSALPPGIVVEVRPVLTTAEAITAFCREANADPRCIGVAAWMHTFSPARMWIVGLKSLAKPLVHLHTQFLRDIPFAAIDMDYMNLHQAAHGDREFGHICTRLDLRRKVIVGHWQQLEFVGRWTTWARAAAAWHDWQNGPIARFGDNMRNVAVTEGDKTSAQIQFGFCVNGYGVGLLARCVDETPEADVRALVDQYLCDYALAPELAPGGPRHESLREAAKIEAGMRRFLREGGFQAFTTTFEDLHGLRQLPGLAVQRLMAEGYGFGAEGDWKTAALVRALKAMARDLPGGSSFMEDYTYHLDPHGMMVLGAHMLEVCPTLAGGRPSLEIHPLAIGGKDDPCRLVFDAAAGRALNVALIDLGERFRLLVNEVELLEPAERLPRLPVARALWRPQPDLPTSAAAWIYAGGPHHTCLTTSLTMEHIEDFAEIAGVELVKIDAHTTDLWAFRQSLRWNAAHYVHRAR